ncbi:KICSTOR complex protein SZT2 [Nilaparvata lugens]|uniref:KICSTOR complex protein SZT2 n=1 Tax=Nilaparvata lugens TaxID=108931 RepID=UPI00193D630E|nr:KICSTOR complex protein SZT2 [Nilaparvata lugens]
MPNCLLMETFYENLKDLHDRDMCLSKEDSKKLIDLIIQREKDNVSLAEEVKEFSEGSTSKTGSNEALEVPMIGDWKRMICWATGDGDPEADTRRPQLHHSWQRRQKAVGASASANTPPVPVQWKCFVKALSSSRCILTLVPASFQDVKVLADFSEEFPASRLRANSWDMMRQSTASIRARTSSVGARVTSRTGDTCGTSDTCSTSRHSITLPLFVYDCLVSNLIDANSVKTGNDIFIDKTNETADDPSSERDSDNSDITLEELSLREHCKMVMQSFNNAFVVSLFKSLRLGNSIHAVDVKTAVEECEESSVEIDITNYLKTVCGHLKELFAENQVENTDSDVLLSVFKHPGPCLDYKHLHKLIKNKFLRILTASFKAVSSDPKYYFCSPMWERDRQNCSNQKKRNAQKSQETATKNLKVVSTPFGHDDSLRVLESSNEFDSLHFTADISDLRCDQISMHDDLGLKINCASKPDLDLELERRNTVINDWCAANNLSLNKNKTTDTNSVSIEIQMSLPLNFWDVKVLADFSEEFPASRLRANSWDMMRQSTASIRARTSSVGARVTSRTGDTCGTSDTCSTSRHSITLPLFVYDCLVSNLIDANSVKTGNDIFIDKTNETADDPSSERDSDNSDITLEELSLREHCKMVMQSFNNAFVVSLFKSLRLGNSIHAVDVKTAVEECEESSVEIDITNYLKTVCGHLKELFAENQVENTDSDVLLSVFKHPGPCLDYKHLHKLIKNKFLRILTASFKAVSSDPKYYFCSPMWERDRQNCSNQKKRNAQKSQETATKNLKVVSTPFGHDDSLRVLESSNEFDSLHFTADISDLRCDQISMHGQSGWEGVANNCVTTPDDARTSLIANMDSDSISNFPDDESVEEVSPLFLHLDCSLNSAGDSNNCTVKIIPTCLNELLDVDNNKLEKLNLSDMKVVLRLVLTAKTSTQPPLSQPATTTDTSTPQLHHLPDNQQKAVAQCVKEIEWLMHDEIAAFMLDVVPVSQETLQFVSHHVETSVNRPSCLHQLVPLKFVFGLEHSMGCFLKDLAQMTIPGYCLQKEGDYYFLIKDENSKTQKSNEESFCNYSQSGEFWVSSTGSQTNDDKKSIDSPSWTRTSDMRSCSQEFNKSSISGWSSVAAWHHNVSSLMENGLAAEDIYNVEHMDESSDWLSDLERRRAILPNFWLIMKVDKESVSTYFHCRFLELETQKVKLYSLIQRSVVKNISEVCKVVNQTMLLQNLHNTRLCNPLLEPETTDDDTWTSSPKIQSQVGGRIDLESGFPEGIFACNVVWKTHFALHPRLKTGPGKPRLSRAIQALQTVLNRFSVNNRNNMFVYQDKNENVFYLRLYEKTQIRTIDVEDGSPGSVSRSSSINSLNREYNKRVLDDQISVNKEPPRPRLKSFGESGDGSFTSKQEDFITLQVHGIYEAGSEVKLELVQVLQNRLNDAVLEVVSVMLARNPMCKLSPEDVHFIQKPNSTPDNFIKFTIPLHATSYLQALAYFLRQNLLQFLHMPKYTDSRIHNHFQDYTYPNDSTRKIPEENILLYNQSHSSGNKGIACIGFSVVNADGSLLVARDQCPIPSSDAYYKKPLSESEFHPFTETSTISDQEISESAGDSTFIEFRVWKQGRVNIESLTHMLKASIRHTLWDLLMEYNLLTAPLTQPSAEQEKLVDQELAPIHQTITVPWLKLAVSMGVPAVKPLYINLTARSICYLYIFFNLWHINYFRTRPRGRLLKVCGNVVHDYVEQQWTKSGSLVHPDLDFKFRTNTSRAEDSSLDVIIHVLEDFDITYFNYWFAAHSISSHYPPFCDSSSDPMLFIPRQRFLLAVITSENITIYTYNWAKERIELMKKHVSNLGNWLSARCSLLTGILAQKMGLFHNKPYARKTTGQSGLSHTTDVESLVSFSMQTVKQQRSTGCGIAQLSEVLRDTKPTPIKKLNTADPVVINVQRILDSRNDEKRDHQKKLYMMWQARGATPNIPLAEDILHIFIQHSRNIHYCLTPLLFLPRWRIQSAATRDHSLKVVQASSSDSSVSKSDDKWHQQLCHNFVHEYKQYLQSLGFIPIQIGPSTPKKGMRRNSICQSTKNSCFLQKSLLGGILLFELFLSEPFFHTKLHALECSRLQSSTPLLSQFIMSFLDECDRVKILMHLHSFTYDYHLRCLHWFISNKQVLLRPNYHITSFLDDFIKYYTKAPNYATSLVFSDSMLIRDISIPSMQLFSYLLNNEKDYKMEVYCMLPSSENSQENEFILVQLSQTPQIIYKDAHDMKQTDDFDVTLMIAQQANPDPNTLSLHFYLLLTSRRELYPNLEIERKLGKFCPVSTVSSLTETDGQSGKTGDIVVTPVATQHNEIRPECVNYVGYYSSHEQLMQQLIMEEAEAARRHIMWMTSEGSLDCTTHLLWNKLMSNYPLNNTLTYGELMELCNLAQVELLSAIDARLSPLLAQSLPWYQSLVKVLAAKYSDLFRTFISADNNTQHFLILHPKLMKGFVMLTLDMQAARGEISIVCRKSHRHDQHDVSTSDLHSLIEGVVNATGFHIWTGLL